MLDGKRVRNLLDIPPDAKVLIASDQLSYQGVDFENVALTELNKQVSLMDLVNKRSLNYSNTEVKPMTSKSAAASRFFPDRKGVGSKQAMKSITARFV